MSDFSHLTNAMIYQHIPDGTDQLTLEIYAQLLDHYICDLQMDYNLAKMTRPADPVVPRSPYPWETQPSWPNQPYFYGTPYKVTCNATTAAK